MIYTFRLAAALLLWLGPISVWAQDLTIKTVTRMPFSMEVDGEQTGFAMELWQALAEDLGWEYTISRVDSFADMLGAIEDGSADAAVANISITANRELVMDFSQPIFEAGLQIMTHADGGSVSIWTAIMSKDMLLAIAGAFALLFGGGMLMWYFEKHHQDYFAMPAKKAMFPAFWWALNLVVNGGFEERQPRSPLGRVFGVFLVISSLFLVSIFVARITAVLTIDAIQSNVTGISDLYGKPIGTVQASTAADFLERRDLRFDAYANPAELIDAFEQGEIDAVVFDAPILAYYVTHEGRKQARLVGQIFLPENYGIALPTSSPYADQINHSLLKLREDGTYDTIYRKWFGAK
ncbi:transporter substrate-binding domain-containing protein [Celeribacter neptunius]|uniref:Amino acid ABC transporter substrate-binding protein, PAAT family n=1 Tax=Celeribacter neptunius TaxID=588602 RepID=A0A1I3WR74_9RHOB|nr:transporter substrate-binding domain-containing protein [Celeribacter neptunius]SFK10025.1 amino acid ABC transporter substrate-binding protein, PAAT family [Celeribacter neptunius]